MRLSIYFLTLVFLSSCTTIEVGREVVKVGSVLKKDKVEETITKEEPENIEEIYHRPRFSSYPPLQGPL